MRSFNVKWKTKEMAHGKISSDEDVRLTPSAPAGPNCCCSKGLAPEHPNVKNQEYGGLTSMAKCEA